MPRTVLQILKQNNQLDTLLSLNKTINDQSADHISVIRAVMQAGMLVESAMEHAVQEQMKEVKDLLGPPLSEQIAASDDEDDSKPTHVLCSGKIVRVN